MIWTVIYGGVERTLADWGLSQGRITWRSQAASTFEFKVTGRNFDTEEVFAFGAALELWRRPAKVGAGGQRWFVGEVRKTPRQASGSGEGQSYMVADVWDKLERTIYRQHWATDGGGEATPFVFLNANRSQAQQIGDVIGWAVEAGLPVAAGSVVLLDSTGEPLWVPPTQTSCKTCAQVIRDQLVPTPDAATWIDPTQNPPALNVGRRKDLPRATLKLDGIEFDEGSITERRDLQLRAVSLYFRKLLENDGKVGWAFGKQQWPEGGDDLGPDVLVDAIDLAGLKVQKQHTHLVVTKVLPDWQYPGTLNWWKKFYPKLTDPKCFVQDWTDVGTAHMYDTDGNELNVAATLALYPNMVEPHSGHWVKWLEHEPNNFTAVRVKIVTEFLAVGVDNDGNPAGVEGRDLHAEVTLTDAPEGENDYETTTHLDLGESGFPGMARYLYESHAELMHEGRATYTLGELDGRFRPGMRLDLATASGRYANMGAMVQEVEELIDSAETTVSFGPPGFLAASDLVQWIRGLSNRKVYENPATQASNDAGAENKIELPRMPTAVNTTESKRTVAKTVVAQAANGQPINKDNPTPRGSVTHEAPAGVPGTKWETKGKDGKQVANQPQASFNTKDGWSFTDKDGNTLAFTGGRLTITAKAGGAKVVLDIAQVPAGKTVQLMQQDVCVNKAMKKRVFLESEDLT